MTDSSRERLIQMGMNDTLARYLLGSLSEEETARLDELSIADDEFAARLEAAEHELIDAYVAGELSVEDSARFEAVYAGSENGRARIAFARTLAGRISQRSSRAWWYPAMAAAAMVMLAVGGYSLMQPERPESPPGAPPPAQTAAPPPSVPASSSEPSPMASPSSSTVLSFVLAAPTRSAADPPAIRVPEGTVAVELRLEIEGDDFLEYDATLKDAAGVRTLWRSNRVAAAGPSSNRVVAIRVPGNLLTARRHVLELRGVTGATAPQVLGAYAFRVVVQ